MKNKIVVFADLDGTVLDERYSYCHTQPIIQSLLDLGASIVLASSKTRAEIEFYRSHLCINDPFIVEDGSAIFIPKTYFKTAYTYTKQTQQYYVIELGATYTEIRKKLASIEKVTGAKIVGFGDMTVEELAADTGLPLELAQLARAREYDEPFRIIEGSEHSVVGAIEKEGFNYTRGGRYFHILGNADKGKAAAMLTQLYQQEFPKVVSIGVGDSPNDYSMFAIVDKPFIITADKSAISCWRKILELTEAYVSSTKQK